MDPAHPRFGYFEVFVKGIYKGSPADRSAITEGDSLVEINGENIKGLSLRQIAPRIIGKLNSPIQLGFRRLKLDLSSGPPPAPPIPSPRAPRAALTPTSHGQ
jgi:hypothetical protein